MDSPDPSKTQLTVGMVLSFIPPPASRGGYYGKFTFACRPMCMEVMACYGSHAHNACMCSNEKGWMSI